MKIIILFLFLSLHAYALDEFLNLSLNKHEYHIGEQSVLLVELNISSTNPDFEFFIDGELDGSPADLKRVSDDVWSDVSAPLLEGTHTWKVSLYFIRKVLYSPLRSSLAQLKSRLESEVDPAVREVILVKLSKLEDTILRLKRHVKDYTVNFEVVPGVAP